MGRFISEYIQSNLVWQKAAGVHRLGYSPFRYLGGKARWFFSEYSLQSGSSRSHLNAAQAQHIVLGSVRHPHNPKGFEGAIYNDLYQP